MSKSDDRVLTTDDTSDVEVVDTIASEGGLRLQVRIGDNRAWVKVPGESIDLVVERRARAVEAAG